MTQPIHIVMTPTRNEAWVIRAFLESTIRWADYVIICDQFSTDGTREIVAEYADSEIEAKKGLFGEDGEMFYINEMSEEEILEAIIREVEG